MLPLIITLQSPKKMMENVIGLRLLSPLGYKLKPLELRYRYDH